VSQVEYDSVAVVASLYPALASGDRDTLERILAPDFTGDTTPGLPLGLGGHYDSPDAMRRSFWGGIARAYTAAAHPASFGTLSDGRVVVRGKYVGQARATEKSFEADFVHIVTVEGAKLTHLYQLTDSALWADALTGA